MSPTGRDWGVVSGGVDVRTAIGMGTLVELLRRCYRRLGTSCRCRELVRASWAGSSGRLRRAGGACTSSTARRRHGGGATTPCELSRRPRSTRDRPTRCKRRRVLL